MFGNFYRGKKVLITGHAGFKGGWLALWLKKLGAEVCGYSLLPDCDKRFYDILDLKNKIDKNIIADISDEAEVAKAFAMFQPEIVFHLAAQPLVRESYDNPLLTYQTNVIGTMKMLEAARQCPRVKAFINITSDKCYENQETGQAYKENDAFGGYDIYSSSKACSEILSASYRRSFLKDGKPFALATARAGNVIGGGDWGKDRLLTDCIKSLVGQQRILIRNPKATRPWQFVLEPLSGYLRLGQLLFEKGADYAEGFNFGPNAEDSLTVGEIAERIVKLWGKGEVYYELSNQKHEATRLELCNKKALEKLGVKPVFSVDKALEFTIAWYKAFYEGSEDMTKLSLRQIAEFEQAAGEKHA